MKIKEKISPTMEDYLEVIYLLSQKGEVSLTDIAKRMDVAKPTAHSAMHKLQDNNYINSDYYTKIQITEKGREYGKNIYSRHQLLSKFLNEILGLPKKEAEKEACLIEHAISQETYDRLKAFIKIVLECPEQEIYKSRDRIEDVINHK